MLKHKEYGLTVCLILLSLALRLPQLDTFLTADEPKSWFGRAIQFLAALAQGDWLATFDSPAPGATTMWTGAVGLLLHYVYQDYSGDLLSYLTTIPFDPLDPAILPFIRLTGVLISTVAVALTYWWGRVVFGQLGAILTALLFALDPFLLALSRILGHDALVTIFMWLSLLAFLRAINDLRPLTSKYRGMRLRLHPIYLILSGICGGLAFLTKYPSLFLGAFIALVMLILHLHYRQSWRQALKIWCVHLSCWSLAAALTCFVLWPALWVDPLGRVITIIQDALIASGSPHQKGSFFFGQPVPDPGLSYYLIVTGFRTTIVLWVGWLCLLIVGVTASLTNGVKVSKPLTPPAGRRTCVAPATPTPPLAGGIEGGSLQTALILLTFVLLYTLLVSVGGKKQDRYILPAFPALAALAGMGYSLILTKIAKLNLKLIFIGLIIALQALLVMPHFPYYFTYYNPFLGGGQKASEIMIVGWGEGLDEAARWLNAQPQAESLEAVAWYSTTFEPYFHGRAIYKIEEEKISRSAKSGLAAHYVIFYINQLQRQLPSEGALQHFRAVPPIHIVRLNGLDYVWIYPSLKMEYVMANEARLVGQAELQGFDLRDETGQAVKQLPSNETTFVQLYWEWQGKSPEELIGLSLVDEGGRTWGWGTPLGTEARLPFEAWQHGMIARDDFALSVFSGTPPGDYYLSAWIDRPATGELVGRFPVDPNSVRVQVSRPNQPPDQAELPLQEILNLDLQPEIRLLGFISQGMSKADENGPSTEIWHPGQSLTISLYWQALDDVRLNHEVTFSLQDDVGTSWMHWVGLPVEGRFPTNRWQATDIVHDPWSLHLPAYIPPDTYTLYLRLAQSDPLALITILIAGRPRHFEQPPLNLTLDTSFGEGMTLLGLQAESDFIKNDEIYLHPKQPFQINLVWQADQVIDQDYIVTVQLIDQANQVQVQRDSRPLNGLAPTTSWTPGEILIDSLHLDLPDHLGTPPHHLLIAVYHPDTGIRLPLANGEDHLRLRVRE